MRFFLLLACALLAQPALAQRPVLLDLDGTPDFPGPLSFYIADVFDALTSRRPYKEPWSVSEALELIRRERGEHFDPELVDAFERCLPEILAVRERWQEDDDVLGYTSGVLAG